MKQYNKYYILVSTNITVILNTLDHGTSIVHNLIVNIKAATTKHGHFLLALRNQIDLTSSRTI